MRPAIYSVGHSNLELCAFIALLNSNGVSALADVRSHPYSRFAPHFDQKTLRQALSREGIAYVYLGTELGGRSANPDDYDSDGRVLYERVAQSPSYVRGLNRLRKGMAKYRIALMCAEKDPITCHRALLVSRSLSEDGIEVVHIHSDGATETHNDLEARLLKECGLPTADLFSNRNDLIADAYRIQASRVAYQDKRFTKENLTVT